VRSLSLAAMMAQIARAAIYSDCAFLADLAETAVQKTELTESHSNSGLAASRARAWLPPGTLKSPGRQPASGFGVSSRFHGPR
jgi:hypothetical protein